MALSVMVQGTTSNAGKSLVAAGLCRIFKQDGYRVAPFKSQNMALNSFITNEGLEMGRAQVMQAEAAGIEPSVLMNPVLLKPTSDEGSQVIVMGEVTETLTATEYYARKHALRPIIQKAYDTLASQNDIIVIEGAGSPAEINLNDDDFVNMGMARMADAPVLLVGDIDRGGVFASLYGTVELVGEDRERIKGLIINKFRGDVTILRPGFSQLEELCRTPVLGVIPYVDLDLDDEDSLSSRLTQTKAVKPVDVAVIRLPRLSNFTDFNALSRNDAVGVRYVSHPDELGNPDLIILPGTKNTMGDLRWLREGGLEPAIKHKASQGTPVLGICGGYQMLGMTLKDPEGVEEGGEARGLELLPIDTVFETEKVRTRIKGHVLPTQGAFAGLGGCGFDGYEIHMGVSTLREGAAPLIQFEDGRQAGASAGNVAGCYIHGIFDEEVAPALMRMLLTAKGLSPADVAFIDPAKYKEQQYDKLADVMRESLDLDAIYRIVGIDR